MQNIRQHIFSPPVLGFLLLFVAMSLQSQSGQEPANAPQTASREMVADAAAPTLDGKTPHTNMLGERVRRHRSGAYTDRNLMVYAFDIDTYLPW